MHSSLYLGDCTEVIPQLNQEVDLVIADPPYKLEMPEKSAMEALFEKKGIKPVRDDWDQYTLDQYIEFTENWITSCLTVLKPHGSIFSFGTYHNSGLVNYVVQKMGLMIINDITWFKRNAVPNLACRRFTASTETILWFARDKKYVFNYPDMKNGEFPEDHIKKPGKQMRTVWDIPTAGHENVGHTTQKPVTVYERIIKAGCRKSPDSIILDPFAGSGTLAVAAHNTGYNSVLIEKDPKYLPMIQKRVLKITGKDISVC